MIEALTAREKNKEMQGPVPKVHHSQKSFVKKYLKREHRNIKEIKQEKRRRTQGHVIPNSSSPAPRIMAKADSPRHIGMKHQNIDAEDQIFSFYKDIFLMDE